MVGASARYSCLHAPVETVTPPRQTNIMRSYGRANATISTDDVRLPLALEPALLGFKGVKNDRGSVFLSNPNPLRWASSRLKTKR